MAKPKGNTIDVTRDPRRQPVLRPPEPLPRAERNETNSKTIQARPNPASKDGAKATTRVPSSPKPSNRESQSEVSPGNGLPSSPVKSRPRSQSTKIQPSSTTVSPRTAQGNAMYPSTPDQKRVHRSSRTSVKNPTPSPLHLGSPSMCMLPEPSRIAADTEALMYTVPQQSTPSPFHPPQSTSALKQKPSQGTSPSLKLPRELTKITTRKKFSADGYTEKQPMQKPNPLYTDISERLRRDSETETQYIKGVGEVIVRHGPESGSDAKPATPRVLDDESFPVRSYLNRLRLVDTQYMRWISEMDEFQIILNASETITIPAKAISSISYNYECRKFYLFSNESTASANHLEESILEVGGDQQAPSKLRSLFERRLSGFKVHKVDTAFFDAKEHAFQRLNIGALPLRSSSQPDGINTTSSDGLEEGVIEDIKALRDFTMIPPKPSQSPRVLQQATESSPVDTIQVQTSSEFKPQVSQDSQDIDSSDEKSQLILPVSEAHPRTPDHSMRRKRKPTEPTGSGVTPPEGTSRHWLKNIVVDNAGDRDLERGGHLRARRTSEALVKYAPPASSSPLITEADPSEMFFYNSKELVRKNDLVIRIRDPNSVEGGRNKHDRLDVYDGPFRISRLPKISVLLDSQKNVEKNGQTLVPPLETTATEVMKEALVKLYFPSNSKGKALTKLGRLRPVYEVPKIVPEACDARSLYYMVTSEGHEGSILNTLVSDKESDDCEASTGIRGVCRIQKGAYVHVDYVGQEGPNEDSFFEVEKLRGKRIDRHPIKEFPDERMDDPTILRYLENGGHVDKSQVLVVKYLVHWAGWPSEDDTWERAQGNIPQDFIDQFNESVPDPYVVIAEPPNKRRKSESLGAQRFVKGS
ncbi:hypothetical protein MMC11_007266 [Xylographa trunciseda]|nr:hypothetical protein [Xylographa trunciseda]